MQNKPQKSNENAFMDLLNFIVDPAVIVGEKGQILLVNNAFEDLTGLNKEVIGKVFLELDLLTPESKAILLKNLMKRMQGLPVEPYEINFTDKTGKARCTEVKAKKVDYDGRTADLVLFRDITQRKENERCIKEYAERMEGLVEEKVEEIKESEEKYRHLFSTMPSGVAIYKAVDDGADFVFVDFNQTAEKIESIPKQGLLGRRVTEVFPGVKELGLFSVFQRVYQTGRAEYLPCGIYKDQRIFGWRENWVYKLPNGNIVSVYNDVTEKKKTEETLRDSEGKLRGIFNSSPDSIVVSSIDAKIIDCNPAALQTFGYSTKSEVIGRGVFEFFAEKDRTRAAENLTGKREYVRDAEYIFQAKNGREFLGEFSTSPVLQSSGEVACFVSTIKDITERKKTEKALHDSEEKFRNLAEQSPNMVFVNKKGRVVYANKKAEEIMGYSKEEFCSPNFNFLCLIAPESREQIKTIYGRHVKNGKDVGPFEYKLVTKNGRILDAILTSRLITYEGDKAILGTIIDITEHKQLEENLRSSEEKFRAISASAMDAIILVDDTGKISYWNPAAERIFGYVKEEAVGQDMEKLLMPPPYHGFHSKSAKQSLDDVRQDYGRTIEFKALRKGGTKVPIELSVSVLEIKHKKHLLGIIRDITERKKMEMTLREAKKRYHALFDKAPLGIVLLDPDTATIIEFNEKAHRQLGYTGEEFANRSVSDFEFIETPEEIKAHIKKVLREGKDTFETRHHTKNGEIIDVINTAQLIDLSGKKLVQVISRDVTEQKKTEQELKLEKEKLESVTENIGAGLAIISKDYHILWANKLLRQINGDCEGKMCYSTFNKLTEVCPNCGVNKVFENDMPIDIHEYSNLDDKGNRFWVELIVTPIKDKNGNVTAALELAVNITERKIMQNKLAEYSQKLEKLVEKRTEQLKQTQAKLVKSERLATIGELAAMVGHDLRNPLTGIMGAAYYLKAKQGTEVGAKGKEMLEIIENAIHYSNKIINDLLEYSRDLKLKLTATTSKAMLQSAVSLLEVPEKIQIIDATKDKPTVKADTEKTRTVFVNIIQNAIDAMPEGGTLTIKSRKVKDKLEIAFKDTGIGMSEEVLSKLKGGVPLFTTKAKGMGFGLPICRRIVEAHGGKIRVESTAGKGTAVTVTIPVNPEPVDEGEEKWIFSESMLSAITAAQRAR
jgi:PAS domain S-box-containing protein